MQEEARQFFYYFFHQVIVFEVFLKSDFFKSHTKCFAKYMKYLSRERAEINLRPRDALNPQVLTYNQF